MIKAPFSGQAGSLLVDRGDLVKVNDTVLVVVNQIQPILVRFTVPEPRLPEVQRSRGAGTLGVRIVPAGAGAAAARGAHRLSRQRRGPDHRHHRAQGGDRQPRPDLLARAVRRRLAGPHHAGEGRGRPLAGGADRPAGGLRVRRGRRRRRRGPADHARPGRGGAHGHREGPRRRRDRGHRRPAAPDAGRDGGAQDRALGPGGRSRRPGKPEAAAGAPAPAPEKSR